MPVEPAAAPPVAPAAPVTDSEFQAAALAALNAESPEPEATSAAEPAIEPVKAGEVPAKEEEKAETKPAETEKKDDEPKGFDVLVREKAALRKREQQLHEKEQSFAKFEAAKTGKDPLALLAAAGFSYRDLVQQVIDGKISDKPADGKTDTPEVAALRAQVAEMQKMFTQSRVEAQQAQVQGRAAELALEGGDKFKVTTAKKMTNRAIRYLEEYYQQVGEWPAATLDDSLVMALEAVEADLRREADSWRPFLTPGGEPAKVVGTEPAMVSPKEVVRQGTSGQAPQSKTLTNSLVAPARSDTDVPRTSEEYQRKALAELMAREGKSA